jgi:hypothetical protein
MNMLLRKNPAIQRNMDAESARAERVDTIFFGPSLGETSK